MSNSTEMSDDRRISHQPKWDAVNQFDVENNVEPFITTAERILSKYIVSSGANDLAVEIAHALEDAYSLGEKRGPLVAATVNQEERGDG